MTLLVFKSCWFIERVPSSVRDVNMVNKNRDERTDKVMRRTRTQPRAERTNMRKKFISCRQCIRGGRTTAVILRNGWREARSGSAKPGGMKWEILRMIHMSW
jgi:hypothetical protein